MALTLKDFTMSPNKATNWGLSVQISNVWGDILHSDHHTQYNKKQNKAEPKPWQLQYEEATETTLCEGCAPEASLPGFKGFSTVCRMGKEWMYPLVKPFC